MGSIRRRIFSLFFASLLVGYAVIAMITLSELWD